MLICFSLKYVPCDRLFISLSKPTLTTVRFLSSDSYHLYTNYVPINSDSFSVLVLPCSYFYLLVNKVL